MYATTQAVVCRCLCSTLKEEMPECSNGQSSCACCQGRRANHTAPAQHKPTDGFAAHKLNRAGHTVFKQQSRLQLGWPCSRSNTSVAGHNWMHSILYSSASTALEPATKCNIASLIPTRGDVNGCSMLTCGDMNGLLNAEPGETIPRRQ